MDYSIQTADLEQQRDEIVAFWRTHLPGWPDGKYGMFYEDNPDGPGVCWLARERAGDEVVGATALFPRRLQIAGNLHLAGIAGDLGVAVAHRGKHVALSLHQALVDYFKTSNLALVYGTANVGSERVVCGAGYQSIGRTVRMVRVLRFDRYLKRYLGPLAGVAAWPIDRLRDSRLQAKARRWQQFFELEGISRFDDRFDRLWQRASERYAIVGERNSRFLNWRFTDCPYKEFQIFALIAKPDRELAGYLVYQVKDGDAHIEDLFVAEPDIDLEPLLTIFLAAQQRLGISAVNFHYFGSSKLLSLLRRLGFSVRRDYRTMVICVRPDAAVTSFVTNPENWHFLHADNDVDI